MCILHSSRGSSNCISNMQLAAWVSMNSRSKSKRRAFEFFESVPKRISYDNRKMAVAKVIEKQGGTLTGEFLRLKNIISSSIISAWSADRTKRDTTKTSWATRGATLWFTCRHSTTSRSLISHVANTSSGNYVERLTSRRIF